MKTQTTLTNGQITIVLNLEETKAANYRKAVQEGYTGDSTGFGRLLNGKKSMVKGFEIKVIEITPPKPIVIKKPQAISGFDSVKALEILDVADLEIKVPAVRQTYGSLKVSKGRLQITPIKNGTFGIIFYQAKGIDADAMLNKFDVEYKVGAKYTTIKRVDAETLNTLIASL